MSDRLIATNNASVGGRKADLRSEVSLSGSYVSIPAAFKSASDAVKLAPKIAVRAALFHDASHPLQLDFVMDPHQILIDLEAVDPTGVDIKSLIRDCELLKEAAEKAPEELLSIIAAFGRDVPHQAILKADETAKTLRLSEAAMTEDGGGFLLLLVAVAAIALSGCKGCAHTEGSMRQ
jgi:hypothetical protein